MISLLFHFSCIKLVKDNTKKPEFCPQNLQKKFENNDVKNLRKWFFFWGRFSYPDPGILRINGSNPYNSRIWDLYMMVIKIFKIYFGPTPALELELKNAGAYILNPFYVTYFKSSFAIHFSPIMGFLHSFLHRA